jgi:hypothetical protein
MGGIHGPEAGSAQAEGPGMNVKRWLLLSFMAVPLGVLGYFMSGTIFILLIFGGICYAIYRNTATGDRDFVIITLVTGFAVRAILAVALHAYFYTKGFYSISGDDLLYTTRAWALVYEWEGKPYGWALEIISRTKTYGLNPFTYILAAFFKIFGYHPVASKLINCIIGSLIGWMAYMTAKEMFGRKTAMISMAVTTFYPSLIRWSVANLKDPFTTCLFICCMYILIKFIHGGAKIYHAVLFFICLLLQYFFVQILFFFLIIGMAIIALAVRSIGRIKRRTIIIGLASILLLASAAGAYYLCVIKPAYLIDFLYMCEEKQIGVAGFDRAGYKIFPGHFLQELSRGHVPVSDMLLILSRSVSLFMLAPFPWAISSLSQVPAVPQLILWYALLVMAVFGFIHLMLSRPSDAVLIGIMLAAGIITISLVEGNVGAAFRHRDIFAPFIIILASAAIVDMRRGAT